MQSPRAVPEGMIFRQDATDSAMQTDGHAGSIRADSGQANAIDRVNWTDGHAGGARAVPEAVVRRGAADRVTRLALRLAVTALRCAAPSVASECCASTCRLLSGILRSTPVPRCPPVDLQAPQSTPSPMRVCNG